MTVTHKSNYGTDNQTITVTLASLAAAGARASTVVDNTTDLALDALVQVKVKTSASALGAQKAVNVYAYGTVDATGPTYPEGITGTDGGITLTSPTNLKLIGTISTPASSTSYASEPMSVAAAFGGVLPEKWGIVVENQTGQALDSTAGNHKAIFQEIFAQTG